MDKSSTMLDNQEINLGENYCYFIKGFIEGKASISNTICIDADKNYNPLPIPNAFTPNSDGLNDYFPWDSGFPKGLSISDFTMYIYNSWGEEGFFSDDIMDTWDGKIRSDGQIFSGHYAYIIKIKGQNVKKFFHFCSSKRSQSFVIRANLPSLLLL